ncbi:TetR/AcrR family transcriptional regulator [Streptomyces sp. GC420]|uniref:TetR/AcrR family transcriptional regulator n=1 Tax=Streptomyces sp. GC420 TaxID=2697568 RepID=UPI0028BE339F|nr:TetR/AcrR family transcriptional regulator [Streptomyces sp. GC420]
MAKQERAARTHERFLDASADEFARHGYAGANLQRIASQVGMTKGALYAHFPSKDALAAVFTSAFDEAWRDLLRKIGDGHPPLATLRCVTVGFVHQMHTDLRFRAGLRLAYEEALARGSAPEVVTGLSAALTRLVGEAQDQKELAATHSPELTSSLFLSLIFGSYHSAPSEASLAHSTQQVRQVWQLLAVGDTAA